MRLEFMPVHFNVVRFPLERRLPPSLRVLRAIAPDLREAAIVAEAFGLPEITSDVRHVFDAQMAKRLADERLPTEPRARRAALLLIMRPLVVRAVRACSRAAEMLDEAMRAQRRYLLAQQMGDRKANALSDAADAAASAAAHAFDAAARRSEEVEGAARALDLALQGETWRPWDSHAEGEELFFGDDRSRA